MTVAGSGEPVDNWAAGAGANYFYSVANINRERRPGTSYYCCLMLGWRQLQAAVQPWLVQCFHNPSSVMVMVRVMMSSISSASGDQ